MRIPTLTVLRRPSNGSGIPTPPNRVEVVRSRWMPSHRRGLGLIGIRPSVATAAEVDSRFLAPKAIATIAPRAPSCLEVGDAIGADRYEAATVARTKIFRSDRIRRRIVDGGIRGTENGVATEAVAVTVTESEIEIEITSAERGPCHLPRAFLSTTTTTTTGPSSLGTDSPTEEETGTGTDVGKGISEGTSTSVLLEVGLRLGVWTVALALAVPVSALGRLVAGSTVGHRHRQRRRE